MNSLDVLTASQTVLLLGRSGGSDEGLGQSGGSDVDRQSSGSDVERQSDGSDAEGVVVKLKRWTSQCVTQDEGEELLAKAAIRKASL